MTTGRDDGDLMAVMRWSELFEGQMPISTQ
jgi:hypothetical protein